MRLPTLFSERCHKASHALFKSAVIPHFTFFVGCGICFFPFFFELAPSHIISNPPPHPTTLSFRIARRLRDSESAFRRTCHLDRSGRFFSLAPSRAEGCVRFLNAGPPPTWCLVERPLFCAHS